MVWLRRLEAIARSLLGKPHPEAGQVQALVSHVHQWDHCRDYGQYNYRICLNGCDQRRSC